jgi:hypothetical protein
LNPLGVHFAEFNRADEQAKIKAATYLSTLYLTLEKDAALCG